MFGFLLICSLFLVYCSGPQNYVDFFKKRANWAYSYLCSEKILLTGTSTLEEELLPNRYYDIVCKENSKLFLKVSDLAQIISIKLGDQARITLINEKQLELTIKSIKISGASVLTIPPNIICKIDKENIMDKSCIVYKFETWEQLRQKDLSFLKVSSELQAFIKN